VKTSEQVGEFPHYEILRVLLEAAIRDQRAIQASSGALSAATLELRNQTAKLPETLVTAVSENLLSEIRENLDNVAAAARRAQGDFDRVTSVARWKLLVLPACCFLAGLGGILIYIKLAMPDVRKLEELRERQADLQSQLSVLERKGGAAQVSRCTDRKGRTWPCIRTDDTFGTFGNSEGETFRVIFGAKPER
jgi:hypothetical protein